LSTAAQLYEKSHMKKFAVSDIEAIQGRPKWRGSIGHNHFYSWAAVTASHVSEILPLLECT